MTVDLPKMKKKRINTNFHHTNPYYSEKRKGIYSSRTDFKAFIVQRECFIEYINKCYSKKIKKKKKRKE